ncbi:lactadherin-like [Stylophora pistillata]|uniref:lactadherin-like n=1 Tax=Stylophora pistillata TaxID=50429 RepID=UPI000C051DF4|nr:lactadherin-like [Stylophora pistillata]
MQNVKERLKACKEALGLEDGRIPDQTFTASTVETNETPPHRLCLNSAKAWSARTDDKKPWLQVDLRKDAMIKKIATQGKRGIHQHTKTYMVSSRADGEVDFVRYKEDNVEKVRQAVAFEWSFLEALGLEDGRIPDSAFSASSIEYENTPAHLVPLNSLRAWSASTVDNELWIQVYLGKDAVIQKVATLGKTGTYQYTRFYMISSRANGETDRVMYKENNVEKVLQGNNDQETVVSHVLSQHIRARFVRSCPKTWRSNYRTMRVELYGCFLQ